MSQEIATVKVDYNQYKNVLKGAKQGEVVTRFPPEPSGYLHIGHVKASLMNYHYAKMYGGKMILRFDDTNPSKEKEEFVDNIYTDLATLGIKYDILSHTSDHFDKLEQFMIQMIKDGHAYCDATDVDTMRDQRGKGIESKYRNTSPEENLKIFEQIRTGNDQLGYCVRGKIDMQSKNKCLRDPVFWRTNLTPHHRTGKKYCSYPTYDFACPIVDSIEGVTHALRTNEYSDRNAMYAWVQKHAKTREVTIYDFSKLNLVNVCLSKRKLQWFVDNKYVEGWNDPRFPTVQGIMRKGLVVQTLADFMLEQGPSKNTNLQEWDKLWAINKKNIDPTSGRYTAIDSHKISSVFLVNGPKEQQLESVPVFDKNLSLGNKILYKSSHLHLEYEDAKTLEVNEKFTLMKWGNAVVKSIKEQQDGSLYLEAELVLEDKDYKSTKKLNWLDSTSPLTEVDLVEYDHLISVKKFDSETMDLEQCINKETKFVTKCVAEPAVKNLQKSTTIQFERRGFFIIDIFNRQSQDPNVRVPEMIFIPDGKTKNMSTLSSKVDVAKIAGKQVDSKAELQQQQ